VQPKNTRAPERNIALSTVSPGEQGSTSPIGSGVTV
jgi:hypothetical protein